MQKLPRHPVQHIIKPIPIPLHQKLPLLPLVRSIHQHRNLHRIPIMHVVRGVLEMPLQLSGVSIERHEGWIKYVTGKHSDYRSAHDQRDGFVRAGHNFRGPFVTAYNNGDRITVQEALMITHQKWVQ